MTTIHCLGDSHIEAFRYASTLFDWKETTFHFFISPGVSAMRAINPNSGINGQHILYDYLRSVPHEDTLLLSLGEVDCGFIIWYRAIKQPELSIKSLFELSLRHYSDFIDSLLERGFKQFIITSAPLPTILDGQDWGEVANARKEVKAPLRDRIDLTLKFNDSLATFCHSRRFQYLGYDRDILDPRTKLVLAEYLNSNRLDHHLEPRTIGPLLVDKLRGLGYE